MDIKDFVYHIVFLPERAWEAFYLEKTCLLLDGQKKSCLAKMEVKNENLIDTIKKFFPEATIYSKGSRDYIKIKNVDFVIREPKIIGTKGSYGFYIRDIPNLVEYNSILCGQSLTTVQIYKKLQLLHYITKQKHTHKKTDETNN